MPKASKIQHYKYMVN